MKKILKSKRLVSIALILALSACGSSTGSQTTAADVSNQQSDSTVVEAIEQQDASEEIAFTEYVAVDNEECAITITGIEPDNLWGYTVTLQAENKNSEKTYMFSLESAAINGVQTSALFATEVAPGKKANSDITFSDSALQKNGITKYTDIELTFRVYDGNDWSADPVAHETVHIYPYGEESAETYTRTMQTNDIVLVDNDKVMVVATGYEMDDIWGFTVNLYLENKSDAEVMFSVDDASVNGYMMDPFFANSVLPGKCTFTAISWGNSSLEENKIDAVHEIEMRIRAYDNNNWMGDDFANEVVTLKV